MTPPPTPGAEREHDEIVRSAAGAEAPLGQGRRVRVVLDADGDAEPLAEDLAERDSGQRDVDRVERATRPRSSTEGMPSPRAAMLGLAQLLDRLGDRLDELVLGLGGRRHLARLTDRPVAFQHPGEDLRAAEVDADDTLSDSPGPRLPYPAECRRKRSRIACTRVGAPRERCRLRPAPHEATSERRRRRRPRWGSRIALTLLLLVLVVAGWGVASYLSFRGGVADANARLPKAVESGLARQDGLLISKPTVLLLLGTDGDRTAARSDASRSDSILVVRTDPSRHRMAFLSIPRDLRVDVPGHGANKINAAFQLGRARARDEDDLGAHRDQGESRAARRLRRLPHRDRRARRDRRRRAEADPLEPVRLPLREPGAVLAVGGLAVRAGNPAHGRQARARSTRGSARTGSIRPRTTSRAASASRPSCRRWRRS